MHGPTDPTESAEPSWQALAERERARGFPSIAGSRAEIAIPVRQALVDRVLARALSGRSATSSVAVELLQGPRLGLTVSHRVLGVPVRARTVLQIDPQMDLARHTVVLRHEDGALWTTIRAVAGTLGLLPPGVSFGTGTVQVDLRAMAARAGLEDLLPLLKRLVIHGPADGLFAIEADLAVPERAAASAGAAAAPRFSPAAERDARPAGTSEVHQWLADLAGSRARVDLRIHESLANQVLSQARALGAAPAPPRAPIVLAWPWTSFVNDARMAFEDERLVLHVDVEVPSPGASPAAGSA